MPNHFDLHPARAEPGLTGDTYILTEDGPRRLDELAAAGGDVAAIDAGLGVAPAPYPMRNPRCTRREAQIVEILLECEAFHNVQPLRVRCTPDFPWIMPHGSRIKAADLVPGNRILRGGAPDREAAHRAARIAASLDAAEGRSADLAHTPTDDTFGLKVVAVTDAGFDHVYNGTIEQSRTFVVCHPEYLEARTRFFPMPSEGSPDPDPEAIAYSEMIVAQLMTSIVAGSS
jgi:hypothetical protein